MHRQTTPCSRNSDKKILWRWTVLGYFMIWRALKHKSWSWHADLINPVSARRGTQWEAINQVDFWKVVGMIACRYDALKNKGRHGNSSRTISSKHRKIPKSEKMNRYDQRPSLALHGRTRWGWSRNIAYSSGLHNTKMVLRYLKASRGEQQSL